jgi:enterochelin esterase-like enzyme
MAGELVTEVLDYDGGRSVTVYLPPEPPTAVVYAGDGQLIAPWGRHLEVAELPPTMVVGAHRTGDPDEMVRIEEYSPSFNPERFAAHERFLVEDVPRWVRSRFGVVLPPDRTAVYGVSASGELSLALGGRHPEAYGTVFSASPGAGHRPPDALPDRFPRTYLVAGTLEPFFLENARRWADALTDAGVEVVIREREGEHGDPFWEDELPLMVAWAFGS